MVVPILVALGFGSIVTAALTGWFNRPKTNADAQKSTTEAASLMIDQLQEQIAAAIERADKASTKAEEAAERANRATHDLYAANRKIDILTDQLAAALELLQRAGHDVQRFYHTLEQRGIPLTFNREQI